MNKIILMGNLTRDPEVRNTSGDNPLAITRFGIAVNRKPQSRNSRNGSGNDVDFINCVAFGRTGENVSKFFTKGKRIAVEGRLQISTYTKDDEKRYSADVIVENFDFCESKGAETGSKNNIDDETSVPEGYMKTGTGEIIRTYSSIEDIDDDDDDDDLPF